MVRLHCTRGCFTTLFPVCLASHCTIISTFAFWKLSCRSSSPVGDTPVGPGAPGMGAGGGEAMTPFVGTVGALVFEATIGEEFVGAATALLAAPLAFPGALATTFVADSPSAASEARSEERR